ncbi:MAG: hypothetical protein LBK66_09930 [Spirochaetaceae bacterium]|jgi:hypothetical protein|nr:hypothetical protein [Spirochaetaceae bacterium]
MANGKTLKAAIEENAFPPPTRGGKTLTRSVCETRWRVDRGVKSLYDVFLKLVEVGKNY